MKRRRNRLVAPLVIATVACLGLVAAAAAFVRAGIYNVGADDPHYPATLTLLGQLRDASITARASNLAVPSDLMTQARIKQGAGNYAAMCTQCHLAPGMVATELSRGLYPAPPNLSKQVVDAAEAFWVIKHGIKASGMPAWGSSMDDAYIWNMAAFIQTLPTLDAVQYRALVAESGGHSHGGGETMTVGDAAMPAAADHSHADGMAAHHDKAGTPPHHDAPEKPVHVDPPGAAPHSH